MRSKKAKKRVIEADLIYKSRMVERMVRTIMLHGKKSIARSTVYNALNKLNEDRKESLKMFETAIKNIMPIQEVKSRRVGGATYQVPMPLKHDRAEALALRWLVMISRKKSGRPMDQILADELKNAYQGVGDAVKKRDDTHRMAEANRAFAHFARF